MRKKITVLFICMSSLVGAQPSIDSTKEFNEVYLMNLFSTCTLIYCDQDSLGPTIFIKKMEVAFADTTVYFSAYITSPFLISSPFTTDSLVYDADYLQITDGDDGLEFYGKNLKSLPRLKVILDALIRKTVYTPYTGNAPGTE